MNPRLALLAAIHDLPDDDLPRLAYADWLEENGDEAHAEFIRVQLKLHGLSQDAPGHRPLWQRELDLIRANKDAWFGTFRREWTFYEVRRGFLDEITAFAPDVVPHADWLAEHHAVQRLGVSHPDLSHLAALLASPLVATLRTLTYTQAGAGTLAYAPAMDRLPDDTAPLARRPLDVAVQGFRSARQAVIDPLLASPHLGRMARLTLNGNQIGAEGVRRLLDNLERWPMLTRLSASVWHIGEGARRRPLSNLGSEGLTVLANHPAAKQLRWIDVTGESVTAVAVAALTESPHLGGLKQLRLGQLVQVTRQQASQLRQRFGRRVSWGGRNA